MFLVYAIIAKLPLKKIIIPLILFIFVSTLYLHNLSLSVFGGDVGDIVTSAKVMGVPHPSGYPLITFLGFLLTRINFLTPAFMVGLISVFSSSIAVVIFYYLSLKLTKNKLISIVCSLILAFNYLFWFYAEIAEVFALNNFFTVSLILFAYLYYKYKKNKHLYALALLAGFSLTNNYIIAFLFPSILILLAANYKNFLFKPKILLTCLFLFLAGLSLYIYIPIASFSNPPVNWGNVKDLGSFLNVVLRKDYGYFGVGFTPEVNLTQRLIIERNYFYSLITQLTIPVIVLVLLGAISLFKKSKLLFFSFLLAFILSGPFFIAILGLPLINNFYIGIYERFFTMSAVVMLLFLPLGIQALVGRLNAIFKKNTFEKLFIAVFLLIPLLLFKYNFNKTDLHNEWIGDNFAYDLLSPLPQNSNLLVLGDTALFNSWYVSYALNFRRDINILSDNGNLNLQKMTKDYIKKFPERAKDFDVTAKALAELAKTKPVFSVNEIQKKTGSRLIWIPYGIVHKLLVSEKEIPSKKEFLRGEEEIWKKFRNSYFDKVSLTRGSLTISDIPRAYSDGLLAEGDFILKQYHDLPLAVLFFQKAQLIDETNGNVYLGLATYSSLNRRCKEAENFIRKSMNVDPFNKYAYVLLYTNYRFCFADLAKTDKVVKEYNGLFKGDLVKEFEKGVNSIN
ncbi:MAG: DUF2723 domain-containing protein [Patescibacteria group bacterium]|nr:DUF2723 domain-containing protein [Patescibacteria group bacterium]